MRRVLLLIVLGVMLAPLAPAQNKLCTQCGFEVYAEEKQSWGGKTFCGESCKEEFVADRWRCKICNDRYDPPASNNVYSDGIYTYIDLTPKIWDGFCDWCRERVESGTVDPVKDRYRPDSPGDTAAAAPAPVAETAPATEDDHDETVSFLDYLKWMVGVGVGVLLVRYGRR